MKLDYEMLNVRPFGNLKVSLCSVYLYSTLMWTLFFIHKYWPIRGIFIRLVPVQLLSNNLIKHYSVQVCTIHVSHEHYETKKKVISDY